MSDTNYPKPTINATIAFSIVNPISISQAGLWRIIGSVYNAENMPWFKLPLNKQLTGFKSASVRGTAHKNYNGIVFNDEKGREHLSIGELDKFCSYIRSKMG